MDMYEPESANNLRPTRDHHPIPYSKGGGDWVMACARCNGLKGNLSAAHWEAFKKANPQWWLISTKPARRAAMQRMIAIIRTGNLPPLVDAPNKSAGRPLTRHPTTGLQYSTGELTRPNAMVEALAQIKGRPSRVFSVPESPQQIMADALSRQPTEPGK